MNDRSRKREAGESVGDSERFAPWDWCLTLLDQFPALIWRADASGECDWFNRAWLEFTGRTMEQQYGKGWTQGVHPDDLDRCTRVWAEHFVTRKPFVMEIRLTRNDGIYRWIRDFGHPFKDADGAFLGFFGVCYDISDLREYSEELAHLASHDVLTHLLNRHAFEAELHRSIAFARRGTESTVLFADVDRFKACNDQFGHEFGDRILRAVAQAIKAALREVDVVGRVGGDEFAVVLWGQDTRRAGEVSERLVSAVAAVGRANACDIGLSVGIARVLPDGQVTQILAEADRAMYQDKES